MKTGEFSKSAISNITFDPNGERYLALNKKIINFPDQATYVYSFKENRMVYAKGWLQLLGYPDESVNMLMIVNATSERFAKFAAELNDKALLFLSKQTENLEEYSFTIELEKIHNNGAVIPLFSRVAVYKACDGKIEEIIGISHRMDSLRLGDIMQYAAYGPQKTAFEETLNKELFNYYAISRKEKEAIQLASEGLAFKEIANQLNVSQSAIEKRILPLYKRFNVHSLTHLVSFAHQNGII